MNNFKNFLIESNDKLCEKKFGQYLFGELSKWYGEFKEKDTDFEKMVFQKLSEFIRGEFVSKEKDATIIKSLELLRECKSKYIDILAPYFTKLFRGLTIEPKELLKLNFKYSIPTDKHLKESYIKANDLYEYVGRSKVQSWTPNPVSADSFATTSKRTSETAIPCIIFHDFKSDKDLLFNEEFLNQIGYDEDEIIRVENKPIKCELYVSKWLAEKNGIVDLGNLK